MHKVSWTGESSAANAISVLATLKKRKKKIQKKRQKSEVNITARDRHTPNPQPDQLWQG